MSESERQKTTWSLPLVIACSFVDKTTGSSSRGDGERSLRREARGILGKLSRSRSKQQHDKATRQNDVLRPATIIKNKSK